MKEKVLTLDFDLEAVGSYETVSINAIDLEGSTYTTNNFSKGYPMYKVASISKKCSIRSKCPCMMYDIRQRICFCFSTT